DVHDDGVVAIQGPWTEARAARDHGEEVRVDEGPRLKRAKPKNKGGRHAILKRTSHFTVIVSGGEL
ncbi:MAG: large ribosomal subunit protein uL22, partial [Parachlamydiaceae bacterium]